MRSPCGCDAMWGMFLFFIVLVLTVTMVIRITKITMALPTYGGAKTANQCVRQLVVCGVSARTAKS